MQFKVLYIKAMDTLEINQYENTWHLGYKMFFMLNPPLSMRVLSANIYENANNSWHFHIY